MIFDNNLNEDIIKIIEARHHDPFSVLGLHQNAGQAEIRAFLPDTDKAFIDGELPMQRVEGSDFFLWKGPQETIKWPYKIHRHRHNGEQIAYHASNIRL